MSAMKTVFERIIDREIPAQIIYEDDRCIVFRDINAQAPTHLLIIPRKPIPNLAGAADADGELLGHLLLTARKVATAEGLQNGFRIVINNGPDGGQSVDHLHLHLLGGCGLKWPPG